MSAEQDVRDTLPLGPGEPGGHEGVRGVQLGGDVERPAGHENHHHRHTRGLEARDIDGDWRFGDARVRCVDQPHGGPTSLGLRFDEGDRSAAYAIDFNNLTDEMAALYAGVDVWVADCLTRQPHPTHMHLDALLASARELRVGEVYLTHMGNGLDYRTLAAELPDWAAPAYDGLEIVLS